MRFIPLASSSAGNAYLVEEGGARLLLECGVTFKKLQKLAGYRIHDLCGCLITHEHKDHSKCWADLIKNGVRVWASAGTIEKLAQSGGNAALLEELPERDEPLRPCGPPPESPRSLACRLGRRWTVPTGDQRPCGPPPFNKGGLRAGQVAGRAVGDAGPYVPFSIGPFEVLPFDTFHDAAQPVGYLIRCQGEKLAFATDTVRLHSRFPGVHILAVEANYDKDILARCERMPDKVKQRVTNSHMEIGELTRYLQGHEPDLSACREIFLLHLSDASANEGDFVRRVRAVIPPGIRVTACPKIGGG